MLTVYYAYVVIRAYRGECVTVRRGEVAIALERNLAVFVNRLLYLYGTLISNCALDDDSFDGLCVKLTTGWHGK